MVEELNLQLVGKGYLRACNIDHEAENVAAFPHNDDKDQVGEIDAWAAAVVRTSA